MISFDTFRAIEAMLRDGVDDESIRLSTKASQDQLTKIRNGTHTFQQRLAAGISIEGKADKRQRKSTVPVRCEGCGKKVLLPCVLCAANAYKKTQRDLGQSYESIDEVRLDGVDPPDRTRLAQPPDDQPGGYEPSPRKVSDDWESRARTILGC